MTQTIDSLVVADRPTAWAEAGFTVDDGGICAVSEVRIDLVGRDEGRKRIVSWSLRDIPAGTEAIDGLPTTVSDRPLPPAVAHPNGVTMIDHLVVLSPDVDRTVAAFGEVGVEPKRTRLVDPEQYGFDARQTFFRLGEVILELIGPIDPMGDGPASFFGLAYTVRDIDSLPARFGEHLGRIKAAVQPGRRIATLRHKEVGVSVATAFMSAGPDALQAE